MKTLKSVLDRLYAEYDFAARMLFDPIEFPHRYTDPADIEVTGFISCCLAYGKVELFKPVLESIFDRMSRKEKSPRDFLLRFDAGKQRDLFAGVQYRFNRNGDILSLFHVLHRLLSRHGSLEAVFMKHYSKSDSTVGGGLTGLVEEALSIDTSPVYGENRKPYGFLQFFPSPGRGSACKRMNLFLRWMVRDRDIDFGIWKGVSKNKLVIPLDTHIARIAKCLGFTKRSSQDWKTAVEITDALKQFDPGDPLKYDFALCHQGISKVCTGVRCAECRLFGRKRKEREDRSYRTG
ncbi:MAG: TIGR02757 family protein [Alphaproteobacteria bacterium]|uniref:TIGR02757 family protein n=1 Tax=Candidatus Nitrobium versatile TaxID=2884831 RepID=A0A953LXY6_9BACT|nr:TIGR02757 family protein [Candidatus Nitrobium versatile]